MSTDTESRGPGLGAKLIAAVVLLLAGWILIKLVVGIIASVFWIVIAVIAVIAIAWAWRTLF